MLHGILSKFIHDLQTPKGKQHHSMDKRAKDKRKYVWDFLGVYLTTPQTKDTFFGKFYLFILFFRNNASFY